MPSERLAMAQAAAAAQVQQATSSQSTSASFQRPAVDTDYYGIVKLSASSCPANEVSPTRPFKDEVVELSCVFVSSATGSTDYVFHRYIRPTEFPKLTWQTTKWTGVTQDNVDTPQVDGNVPKPSSEEVKYTPQPLDETLRQFELFMKESGLTYKFANSKKKNKSADEGAQKKVLLVSDEDLTWTFKEELDRKNLGLAPMWRKVVQFKNMFFDCYNMYDEDAGKTAAYKMQLQDMLERLVIEFEGNPDSQIDLCKNLAKILTIVIKDGTKVEDEQYLVSVLKM